MVRWGIETTGYGIIEYKTHLDASYSLICVNTTSGELTFDRDESTIFRAEATLSRGEKRRGEMTAIRLQLPMFSNDFSCFRN